MATSEGVSGVSKDRSLARVLETNCFNSTVSAAVMSVKENTVFPKPGLVPEASSVVSADSTGDGDGDGEGGRVVLVALRRAWIVVQEQRGEACHRGGGN